MYEVYSHVWGVPLYFFGTAAHLYRRNLGSEQQVQNSWQQIQIDDCCCQRLIWVQFESWYPLFKVSKVWLVAMLSMMSRRGLWEANWGRGVSNQVHYTSQTDWGRGLRQTDILYIYSMNVLLSYCFRIHHFNHLQQNVGSDWDIILTSRFHTREIRNSRLFLFGQHPVEASHGQFKIWPIHHGSKYWSRCPEQTVHLRSLAWFSKDKMSFLYLFNPTPKQKLDASQLYGCQGLEFACNPINVFLLKPDSSTNSFSLIQCLLRGGGAFFGRHICVVVGCDYLLSTCFGNIKIAIVKMYSLWPYHLLHVSFCFCKDGKNHQLVGKG